MLKEEKKKNIKGERKKKKEKRIFKKEVRKKSLKEHAKRRILFFAIISEKIRKGGWRQNP